MIFDRGAVRLHRDRAADGVASVANVLADAAERLLDRLDDTTRRFGAALDIGGRGVVAPMLRARAIDTVSMDFSPAMAARNGGAAVAAEGAHASAPPKAGEGEGAPSEAQSEINIGGQMKGEPAQPAVG